MKTLNFTTESLGFTIDGDDANFKSIQGNYTVSLEGTPSGILIAFNDPLETRTEIAWPGDTILFDGDEFAGETKAQLAVALKSFFQTANGIGGSVSVGNITGILPLWVSDYDNSTTEQDLTPPWHAVQWPSEGAAENPPQTGRAILVAAEDVPGSGAYKPLGAAMRVELRPGDIIGTTCRVEALARTPTPTWAVDSEWPDPFGSERWYAFSVYVPEDFVFATNVEWMLITQLKGYQGTSPTIAIEINGSNFRVGGTRANEHDFPDTEVPIVKGVWNRFVFGVKLHTNPAIGWLDVSLNGVNILPKINISTMDIINDEPDPIYLKQGIYRNPTWTTTSVLYFGPTKVGESKASVEPVPVMAYSHDRAAGTGKPTSNTTLANTEFLAANPYTAPLVGGMIGQVKKSNKARTLFALTKKSDTLGSLSALSDVATDDGLYGTTALQAAVTAAAISLKPATASTVPIDASNGHIVITYKPIENFFPWTKVGQFEIQLHSAGSPGSPTGNYHNLWPQLLNFLPTTGSGADFLGRGRWQTLAISTKQFALVGTGADLSALKFAVLNLKAADGQTFTVQLGNISFVPNRLTKARCFLTFDDTPISQLTYAAAQMSRYGFPGILFPSPVATTVDQAGRLSTQQIKNLHDFSGWQIGSQAWTTEDVNIIGAMSEDELTGYFAKLRNWHNSIGVTGGECGSWHGTVTYNRPDLYPAFRKHFRTIMAFANGNPTNPPISIGEVFPFGNPSIVTRYALNDNAAFNQGHVDQAIQNKGIAAFGVHDELATAGAKRTAFNILLEYLDANRANIEVCTEQDTYYL